MPRSTHILFYPDVIHTCCTRLLEDAGDQNERKKRYYFIVLSQGRGGSDAPPSAECSSFRAMGREELEVVAELARVHRVAAAAEQQLLMTEVFEMRLELYTARARKWKPSERYTGSHVVGPGVTL